MFGQTTAPADIARHQQREDVVGAERIAARSPMGRRGMNSRRRMDGSRRCDGCAMARLLSGTCGGYWRMDRARVPLGATSGQ